MRAVLVVFVVGCATSSDRTGPASSALEGLYDVVLYAASDSDCAVTDEVPPFPQFRIEVDRVVNQDTLVLSRCSSANACSDPIYFAEYDDLEATSHARETTFEATSCTFRWIDTTIEDIGGEVFVDSVVSEVSGVDGIDLTDCLEQHEAWTDSTPCISAEQFSGNRSPR